MTFKYRKCNVNIPIMHISIILLQSLFLQIQFSDLSQFANDMLNPIFDSRFFQFNSRYALYQTRAGSQARSTLLKEIYQTHILHKIYLSIFQFFQLLQLSSGGWQISCSFMRYWVPRIGYFLSSATLDPDGSPKAHKGSRATPGLALRWGKKEIFLSSRWLSWFLMYCNRNTWNAECHRNNIKEKREICAD